MVPRDEILDLLRPLARAVRACDLADPAGTRARLEAGFDHAWRARVHASLRAARDEGWLTPKEAGPNLRFGRISRPDPELGGMSVDVVDMEGAGAAHTHPRGEVSLCFAESGDPRFCGEPGPFVVVPPGSHHTPEVTGGRMLIAYFLPEGAITWG